MARTSCNNLMTWVSSLVALVAFFAENVSGNKEGYYGKYIGKLSQLHHGVSGDVFAVDARTLHLRNFNYDGEGPAAYFYAGSSKAPGSNGFRLRDERGTTNVLPKYRNKHITITLPEGKTLQNIKWFSVWCDEFSVNFGDIKIPRNLDYPKPQKISGLSGVHGVSSEPIVIVDAQTLLVPSFSYDGEAPDAKFWVGAGSKPTPRGIRIPDENGKEVPLRRYDKKTIVLTLPGELTIFDIGHFGVWCEAFTVDFGHVQIPRGLNVPPSLKMLGVSPQSKLNCEVLWDDFAYEVRWAVAGDSIVLQLVARLENNEYMSFGLSGDNVKSRMVGGDVVVAWVDKENLKGYAEDYYLDAKSQCSGGRGSCPDEKIQEGSGSVRLLNAALVNGYSIVTFQRSLRAQDDLDGHFLTNGSQPVIWAIGPLNSRKEVSYHSLTNRGDIFIDFGRAPKWNCPTPESVEEDSSYANEDAKESKIQESRKSTEIKESNIREFQTKSSVPTPAPATKSNAWDIPAIKCHEPEDGVFYAQMGPTGGKHGYSAITGHVGWGISWYINGLLIPEINVVRGRTYTFIVEGGLDPETPARYHPFYITDDPVGGYQYKTPEERINIQIFAGAVQNKRGEVRPTGVGRLCNWTPDPNQPPADEFASFGAYQRTLRLECDPGNPGIIQWTVDKDTPDTVYYQCYTHRYLGWKINVHDHCESEAASEPIPAVLEQPKNFQGDIEESESINYEVRVKPNPDFLLKQNQTRYDNANQFESVKINKGKIDGGQSLKIFKNQFDVKSVRDKNAIQPLIQNFSKFPQTVNAESNTVTVSQQPFQHTKSSVHVGGEEKASGISTTGHSLGLSSYSVSETPLEDFQYFQILPSKVETHALTDLHYTQAKKNSLKGKPNPQVFLYQETGGSVLKSEEIGLKSSLVVKIPSEEKLKKQSLKTDYRNKVPVRSGAPPLIPNKRKPSPSSGYTLQQRPFPVTAAFRPLFPAKRPSPYGSSAYSSPVASIQSLNYPFKYDVEGRPTKLKKETVGPYRVPIQGVPIHQQKFLFAQNTGFNPDSVKVEGGFKPILTTERESPRFGLIDRADVRFADDSGDSNKSEKGERQEDLEDKTPKVTTEENVAFDETNPFKNQTPQTFEPIFIPSFPDDHIDRQQEKSKKKPTPNFKSGNSPKEVFPNYVRTRFNHNLNRRLPYPDNLSPPLRAQIRSASSRGSPYPFSHRGDDAVEAYPNVHDNFNEKEGNASNILEIMEMNEKTKENATAESEPRQDEIAMADENKEVYLTNEGKVFQSYDGKIVRPESAPTFLDAGSFADISKLPQFVPFKGIIPPPSETVNAKNLPQLKTSRLARYDILPPSETVPLNEKGQKGEYEESNPVNSSARKKRFADHGLPHQDHQDHHHFDHHNSYDHHHQHHHDHNHAYSGGESQSKTNLYFLLSGNLLLFFMAKHSWL